MANPPTAAMSFNLFFLAQLIFILRVTSYTPDNLFAVNCGNSGNISSVDNREWSGDVGSTNFSLIDPSAGTFSLKIKAPFNKSIPYGNARLSRSQFSYSFTVTKGRKFIRLYFYPYSYDLTFPRSDSLFSVEAGSFTLLKDFNASLAAEEASQETISREYCVYVEPGQTSLNVTFFPNLSHPNAFAFVNGIEVVSMPPNLYYTSPDDLNGIQLKDGPRFPDENNSFIESMYRINVGGKQIAPEDDTGMFRRWDEDISYLEIERSSSVSAAFGSNLNDSDNQDYFAPDEVYKTTRNYGINETSRFNVTWEFQVDSKFHYIVRLHFCEFDQAVQNSGARVFKIFIADRLVEDNADVLRWSGKFLIPVHRDYGVWMKSKGNAQKLNISILLQPLPSYPRSPRRSIYRDVLLNGVEILKLRDDPRSFPSLSSSSSSSSQKNATRVISIVVSALGFISLSLIVCLIYWRRKTVAKSKASKTSGISLVSSDLCRCFSIKEIRAATNNFDDTFIVGIGGFGNVYKGFMDNGTFPVAIKRLKQGSQQGLREFETEIETLSQLRHHHLVSLIGFCTEGNEMILVYEFMARGTLRDHLYDSENQPISWNQRLEICLGAARGLHYLHTGAKHAIIHRDIKSTNILIDAKWMAKISDFGLSKVGPSGITRSNINISTVVKGSIGYLDPEYYTCQRLTEKSDVYSFGVVLLEVLCGRPPILRAVEKQQQNLVEWFRRCVDHENEIYFETVDPFIRESITPECLKAYTEIALKCLADDGNERPSMGDVMLGLESLMEMPNKSENPKLCGTLKEEIAVGEIQPFNG